MSRVAHLNVARLRFAPGDPRVAGFVDNVPRVNAIAERSSGFIWRYIDETAAVGAGIRYEALHSDPCLAISLSLWNSVGDLWHFANKTVHGGFLRRRAEWFEPWSGPNYVVWDHGGETRPTLDDGWHRLRHLAEHGPSAYAYDFKSSGVAID